MRWTVLVPFRALPNAKSRLARTVPADRFIELVNAIRADTLAAVRAAPSVARVVVIGDGPGPGIDVVQHSLGLNGALRDGAAHAVQRWPADGIAALVGDLPALRPAELTAALDAASAHACAFVPDSSATGTTVLTATPGTRLDPHFGLGSAARHARIGTAVDAGPGLRRDVDTADDLHAATAIGVGPATAAVIGDNFLVPRSP